MKDWVFGKISKAWDVGESVTGAIIDDLRESRSVLCWLYSIGYLWLVWYCVTHNPASMAVAITVTGGIVSAIFTMYVFTKSKETVAKITEKAKTARSNGANEDEGDS